jgi:DNA repair photolyase
MSADIFHPLVLSLDPTDFDSLGQVAPGERLPRAQGFLDFDEWERSAGERGAGGAALVQRLRRAAERHEPVAVGTAADPYDARLVKRTRRLLEACRGLEGLALSVTTRSAWVLRDLELLAELDSSHAVSLEVPVTAMDAEVARRLEPAAAEPAERMEAVATVAERGIAVTVWCLPIVAGENDGEGVLGLLFAAAREAGARDVLGSPMFLQPSIDVDGGLLPRLAREIPRLARVCRGIERRDRRRGMDAEARRLAATFRRLRLEHGFPSGGPGRG